MLTAVEMGDGEVARLCRAALDRECPASTDGAVSWRDKASIWSHSVEFAALVGGKDVLRKMATYPRQGRDGPFLEDAPFPDLIVAGAAARSGALDTVFEPGGRPGRFAVGVAGLIPGRSYRCEGAETQWVEAGCDGTAQVHLTVAARHCLRLLPVV